MFYIYIFHFCTEKNTKKAIFEIYDAKIIFYIFSQHRKKCRYLCVVVVEIKEREIHSRFIIRFYAFKIFASASLSENCRRTLTVLIEEPSRFV